MAALTLEAALNEAKDFRWRGARSLKRNVSQATIAIVALEGIILPGGLGQRIEAQPPIKTRLVKQVGRFAFNVATGLQPPQPAAIGREIEVAAVTTAHVRAAVTRWLAEGTKESTVVARLNCLSCLGVKVNGCRPTIPRKLKFWLSPEDEALVVTWCREQPRPVFQVLADYIEWTTRTGLRIEETLALKWSHVHFRPGRTLVTVPGLKTHSAQKTLPVSPEAAAVLARRKALGEPTVFNVVYHELQRAWKEAREVLGLSDPYGATLKALRRSAARSLHVTKGMPLDMVRQYLRHENVETTMGYLRLTGGYGEEEMGRWL